MKFKHNIPEFPTSVCSKECKPDQVKIMAHGSSCCWICLTCKKYQYIKHGKHCKRCPNGTFPYANKSSCMEIPPQFLDFNHIGSVGALISASVGMLVTAAVSAVFCKHWDTPIVKASGRELSAILLLGIFLSYALTFAIVAKPSKITCGVVRFFLGFCFTLCYSSILAKTRRIATIFNRRTKGRNQKPRYISPQAQMTIVAVLISLEVLISFTWLIRDPPDIIYKYPSLEEKILLCKGSKMNLFLIGLTYPFILMAVCTVYAFKTRKCPDGFNEARYIAFSNYTTCIVFAASLPLYALSGSHTFRAAILVIFLHLSGAVQLACLFLAKVWMALMRPERNTRENVMGYHGKRVINMTRNSQTTSSSTV